MPYVILIFVPSLQESRVIKKADSLASTATMVDDREVDSSDILSTVRNTGDSS